MRLVSPLFVGLMITGSSFAVDFNASELPLAVVDQPYHPPPLTVYGAARCPAGDAVFTTEGTLPPGLDITALGQITGVPRRTGTYRFKVRAADACGVAVKPMNVVVTGAPVLILVADSLEFHYQRGEPVPAAKAILVNSTWPDLAYYMEQPDAAWLRAVPRSGHTPKPGSALEADRVEISVNPGSLGPGSYETKLRFWTWQGANVPAARVRLIVE